ncbi:hypothetical protein C2S51_036953 [Perilla frutescens var. frutescens]|nr:hypothetical protein C2S51_036953 [Perilla frutescens var. frutescens]
MMTKEIGGPSGGGDSNGAGGLRNVVRGLGRPPVFLTKIFLMVDDPNSNSIISWGKFGDSFVIWDHLKFSAEIMPQYFKHNNFASFVYQLNNYGFRKIGVEHQWEYRNPYFQAGKQHLLLNMKRRSSQNLTPRRRSTSLSPEMMREAIDESNLEIEKLKMQQLDMDFHMAALEKMAKNVEYKSRKLMVCWAKACDVIAKRQRGETDDDEGVAKRKKVVVESAEIVRKENEMNPVVDEMVKENDEEVPLSQTQSFSSSTVINDSVLDKSKSETTVGNFTNAFDMEKIILEDEEGFEVVEVGSEMANKHDDKIAQDLLEMMITELADRDCSLEIKTTTEGIDAV